MRIKLAALGLLVVGFVLVLTAPASAHAELLSTEPSNGTSLTDSPTQVVLHFGEDVEIPLGSVRVYNSADQSLEKGTARHLGSDQHSVVVQVPHLPVGGYVTTWRVISADSHPVHGAFTFQVGNVDTDTSSLAQKLLSEGKGNITVGVIYGLFRAALVGATTVLVGALAFMYFIAPVGWDNRRHSRVLWASLASLVVATVGVYVMQGVYAAGFAIAHTFDTSLLSAISHTRLGEASIARLAVLVLLALALKLLPAVRRLRVTVFGLLSAAIILSLTLSGHADTGRWIPLAIIADLIHVASACAWAGGLIVLAIVWRTQPADERAAMVANFSALALTSVALLTVTGVFQGYRQLATLHSLFHTAYGVILLVKVAIVAVMVAFGRLARNKLHASDYVRRSVRVEASLAVAVFLVTALLMNATPSSAATGRPFTGELKAGKLLVDAIVTPDRTGTNSIHLYVLSDVGVETDVPELTASLSLASRDLGPIPIPLIRVAPGHWASYSFALPISGKWTLDVALRTTEIDQVTGSMTIPVN